MDIHLLWDADYLTYAAGAVVEKTDYILTYEDQDGHHVHGTYRTKTEVNAVLKEYPDAELLLWSRGPYLEPGAEENAKYNVKSMVDSVLKTVMKRYPDADSITYQMYLTASPNYRDWVAGIRPYKGNRTNVARPLMYDTIRRYLVEVWNAEIISGIEADDEISLAQRQRIRRGQEPAVIVHVDKDLNMIPGPHLNARRLQDGKPCWATVTEDRGLREFYRQVLTGDTADNIPGCHRVGPAKAKALIVPGMTEDEMYELCVQQYMVNLAQYPEHHGETEASVKDCLRHAAELKVIENARLLWMLTKPISVEITGGLWEPPTLRSEDE